MVAPDIGDDGFVHLVAANPHGAGIHNAAQGQNGDFRRAAANIHNHGSCRFGHRQPGANRRRHRFFNKKYAARARGVR